MFSMKLCLLGMLETIPIKSQQNDCLNMNWTKKTKYAKADWSGWGINPACLN